MAKRARGMALGPEAQRTRPTVGLLQLDRRYTATGDAPHDLDQRSCPESPTPRFDPHPNAARRRRHRPRIRHRPRGVARRLFSDGRGGRGIGRRRAVRTAARRRQRDNRQERRHTSIRHGCHSRLRSRRCHQRSPAELVAKVRTERRHNGHLSAATLERLTSTATSAGSSPPAAPKSSTSAARRAPSHPQSGKRSSYATGTAKPPAATDHPTRVRRITSCTGRAADHEPRQSPTLVWEPPPLPHTDDAQARTA
jgi:hypothetical protein